MGSAVPARVTPVAGNFREYLTWTVFLKKVSPAERKCSRRCWRRACAWWGMRAVAPHWQAHGPFVNRCTGTQLLGLLVRVYPFEHL